MQLLLYQSKFIEKLMCEIRDGDKYFLIEGKTGSGKSFTLKELCNEMIREDMITLIIDGDYQFEDREYYPFKKALSLEPPFAQEIVKGSLVEASKEIPVAGNVISYVIKSLTNKRPSTISKLLNDEEQNIVSQLRQLVKKKNLLLIYDNIHWWDRRSLQLLKTILRNNNLLETNKSNSVVSIFSLTSDQTAIHNDLIGDILKYVNYKKFSFPSIGLIEFKKTMFEQTFQTFTDSQITLLYNLVNSHLQVFFEVIEEIRNNNFDFDAKFENNKEYLSAVLEKRLKGCGANGIQIMKTLEYASIIGITFSCFELKSITKNTEAELRKIIRQTSELTITEKTENIDYIKFAHDIIREVFKSRVENYHIDYYKSLCSCIKEIKPDQYLRRARYLLKCFQVDQAMVLYILEAVKQIRLYGKVLPTVYEEMAPLLSDMHIEYIESMSKAYYLYSQKEYFKCINTLNLLLDIFPSEILAERDILKIRCYSKTIATEKIETTIDKFNAERKDNLFQHEKDIWERYSQVLIIAYAHLGKIDTAREIETETLRHLTERIKYDETAAKRLHIIKRVSNSIHNIELSVIFVKDALTYFGKSTISIRDIQQYYMALVNYTAMLIKQGDFKEAYDLILEGFELERNNVAVEFPRMQLLKSNYIIAGYLSGNLCISECIELYCKLINNIPNVISERLFYISNLSIFYSLSGNSDKAYSTLSKEATLHYFDTEKEGLYQYRVTTNSSIYLYMMGNSHEAINNLKKIKKLLARLINGSYYTKKNELLIQVMQSGDCTSGLEWLNTLFTIQPSFQDKAWRYFGLGYAFMSVCNWDMSE